MAAGGLGGAGLADLFNCWLVVGAAEGLTGVTGAALCCGAVEAGAGAESFTDDGDGSAGPEKDVCPSHRLIVPLGQDADAIMPPKTPLL